jgi:transcriptional regulator with PAS, ATPase and Fis domain
MYRLLDLRKCESELRVGPHHPSAILDTEDVAIAAITKTGHLIYCNPAFLRKNDIEYREGRYPNIREVLPGLWDLLKKPPQSPSENKKLPKIINVRSNSCNRLLGHLITFLEKKNPERGKIDFNTVLSADKHPDFVNSYTGLYVADPGAYTVKVNPAYEKIAFLPESDLVGRNLKELVAHGYFSRSMTLCVLDKLKHQDTSKVAFFQKIISGKDVLVTGKPIYTQQGELAYILTFVQDLLPLEIMARKYIDCENKLNSFWPGAELIRTSKTSPKPFSPDLPTFDSLPIVARDPLSISTLKQAVCAAKYDSPILLTGETGVGKDLIAKYVHLLQSGKQNKPFVVVNCSAIPGELLESELFGYEEGAFSGARKGGKSGLFAEAEGGILFLNEISEMPLCLQVKLLTALDEGCIRPLGSSKTKQIKTRIVCATNKDLPGCIDQGSFRRDLYYRIKVLAVHIPPLRDRPQDILPLIHHFMTKLSAEFGVKKYLSPCIQEIFLRYTWPGNVRELRNLVERLLVFSPTNHISVCDLPSEYLMKSSEDDGTKSAETEKGLSLKEAVRRYEAGIIKAALARHRKVAEAANFLGIDPSTLGRKLKNMK